MESGQEEGGQEEGVQGEGGGVEYWNFSPFKEANKASAIPIFRVIPTKNLEMAAKIPWPASYGTSPLIYKFMQKMHKYDET